MEIITKAALVHSTTDIEMFDIKVDYNNYKIVRKKLELEHKKIINMINVMKENGEIKSISKPRNKKKQKEINQLVYTKRILKQSINNISEMFYK